MTTNPSAPRGAALVTGAGGALGRAIALRLGADGFGKASMVGLGAGGAFLIEVILTFVFVIAVLMATTKFNSSVIAGVTIGFALTTVHLLGIPFTGTSVNPARSFGPALFAGGDALEQLWLFIVAPLIGGAIAAVVFVFLNSSGEQLAAQTVPTAD